MEKHLLLKLLTVLKVIRSEEEKERGITIDLSFSNISNGEKNIAFIDVPGHEKMVKNMISGAFGFDSVMIVISAAEGIKPQTIEHLEILKLLGVKDAILVISKKDLVTRRRVQHPKISRDTKLLSPNMPLIFKRLYLSLFTMMSL